jgi:hypothetical protein
VASHWAWGRPAESRLAAKSVSQALLVAVIIAVACLVYVLYPLIRRGRARATLGSERVKPRAVSDDEIEAAIRSYRATDRAGGACPVCGPRPESDAVFCSNCGRRLDGTAGTA